MPDPCFDQVAISTMLAKRSGLLAAGRDPLETQGQRVFTSSRYAARRGEADPMLPEIQIFNLKSEVSLKRRLLGMFKAS